jgi:hypothetical protein
MEHHFLLIQEKKHSASRQGNAKQKKNKKPAKAKKEE